MTDVSHELGALRFVVESPLSSKVAMFNNQATQHKQSQLLNPFSQDGRAPSPKPTFSKDQYGKPLAGSLTEARGQKANMHVMKEMLELCQIISSEGYPVKDEPTMRVIPFGELFNIYNYISDKVVGILLRARKHKLLDFEGEMLYQRRDDDVPIFLLRPVADIRAELNAKIEEIKRGTSPAPQSTSVMLDKSAHEQNLKVQEEQRRLAKSRTPSPAVKSKSKSPTPVPVVAQVEPKESNVKAETVTQTTTESAPVVSSTVADQPPSEVAAPKVEPAPVASTAEAQPIEEAKVAAAEETAVVVAEPTVAAVPESTAAAAEPTAAPASTGSEPTEAIAAETDAAIIQPIDTSSTELPTIVIEASATFVRTVSAEQLDTDAAAATTAESA